MLRGIRQHQLRASGDRQINSRASDPVQLILDKACKFTAVKIKLITLQIQIIRKGVHTTAEPHLTRSGDVGSLVRLVCAKV